MCINLIGSYTCNCTSGYRFGNQTCIGNFSFKCYKKKTIFTFFSSKDINECIEPNIDGSFPLRCNDSQVCINTIGSYTCACNPIFNINGICNCMYK